MDIIKLLGVIGGAAFCYYKGRSDMANDMVKTSEAAVELIKNTVNVTEEEDEEE